MCMWYVAYMSAVPFGLRRISKHLSVSTIKFLFGAAKLSCILGQFQMKKRKGGCKKKQQLHVDRLTR